MSSEKKIRIGARLPKTLYDWLSDRAKQNHGDDFTAALITVLLKAREIIIEEENWLKEKRGEKGKREKKERIGEGLIRQGKMTKEQAEEVLRVQREKYNFTKRFGEIALELMYINRDILEEYLAEMGGGAQ